MNISKSTKKGLLLAGACALAFATMPVASNLTAKDGFSLVSKAFAQGKGYGQGGSGGQGGQGGAGGKGAGGQGGAGEKGRGAAGQGGVPQGVSESDEGGGGRPEGKGGGRPSNSGTMKGDTYGDMWVIERNEDGTPVYVEITGEDGETFLVVQPLDAEGNPIPLDEEGKPVDESLTVEVDLGRTNVIRAPSRVFDRRMDEVLYDLAQASAVKTDAAGRLVVTINGVDKTIDSPLENLALYVALMDDGSLNPNATYNLGDLSFLNDGQLTADDFKVAASLLAAATDKSEPISVDEVAYINNILGLGTITDTMDRTYVNYSTFSYDRKSTYENKTVNVLVPDENGGYVVQEVNIYDTVFGDADYSDDGGIDAFAKATDDARAVVDYLHEYEVPSE